MTVVHIEDVVQRGTEWVIATGTPEAGGLTPREAQAILRGLKGLDIVGGDVVEVAPQYDATTTTAIADAQMLFEILCLMALAHGKK